MRMFEVVRSRDEKEVNLPRRGTKHSAGYDFEAVEDTLVPSIWSAYEARRQTRAERGSVHKPTLIKTGVKARFGETEVLHLYNRSSNPGKKGLSLANGTGVVESDYYGNPDNDGEIMFAYWNMGFEDVLIKKGERIGQGVFQTFLTVVGDDAEGVRTGGFGSTGK